MQEDRARRVVTMLRSRNVFAHVKLPQAGVTQYGVRVVLPDGREAVWDTDGTAGLEAQVLRNGVLVGFVPVIEGSESFGEAEVIEAIAAADYDRPIGRSRPTGSRAAEPTGGDRLAVGRAAVGPPADVASRLRRALRS